MPRSVRSQTPRARQSLMRFALLAVAIIVTIVGGIFAALIVSGRVAHREALNAQALGVRIDHLNELQRNVLTLEMALRGYLLTGGPSFARTYEESRREIGPLLRAVRGEAGADQRIEATELAGVIGDYLSGSADERRADGLTLSPVALAEATSAAKLQTDAMRERSRRCWPPSAGSPPSARRWSPTPAAAPSGSR